MLGYLNPNNFVGGRFKIVPELAEKAITEKIAKPLNLSSQQAALGIIRVVCTNIEVGLRLSFVERGLDPRMFSLLAFGGGGPVLGTRVAKDIGIPRVIVPPYPGISCAMGLLQTDVKHYYLQTRMGSLAKVPVDELNTIFTQLEERARREATQEGFEPKAVKLQRQLDMRYPFQGYELTIDCSNEAFTEDDKAKVRAAFDQTRTKRSTARRRPARFPTSSMSASCRSPRSRSSTCPNCPKASAIRNRSRGARCCSTSMKAISTRRSTTVSSSAPARSSMDPAIIEQLDSTTVILPGQKAEIERYGNIIIEVNAMSTDATNGKAAMKLDPITLEIIIARLQELVSTMEHLLFHSGYSTILRESHDGSCTLLDTEGNCIEGSGGPAASLLLSTTRCAASSTAIRSRR